MGVGLYLKGHSDTEGWIQLLRDRLKPIVHPASEGVQVTNEGVVSAATTPVGPGYHVALCEAIHAASRELNIAWDPPDDGTGDETGYFHRRDLAAVEDAMLRWLQTVARFFVEDGFRGGAMAMSLDHSYEADGVVTPLGPRDEKWLRAVVENPRNGIDFFPWWTPGENAAALLGRARCLMWTEMRWRLPTYEAEEDLEDEVVDLLKRAWALDPSLEYPAREWVEIGLEAPEEIEALAETATGPLIGYRRKPVRVRLPDGWSVEVPGEFSEEWEDGSWSAWHDGRTVWFNGYRKDEKAAQLIEAAPDEGEVLYRTDGKVMKKGYLKRGDDGFILSTRNAIDGKLCLSTIVYPDEDARDWAMRAWESFRCT